MVSVIIPTYNRADLVKEALDSVLAQTIDGLEMEVIVVDDGSSDNTRAVIESRGPPVKYFCQPHQGVSAARNTGIKAASGTWLAFLDSDDLWLPEKLQGQLNFFRFHPNWRICQTEEVWMRNGLRINPRDYHRKPSGYCFSALLERCLISPSAVMLPRSLLDEVGLFDETLPACEDYDLWLRIGCRYPIGLVQQPLVVKRGGRSDQLSTTVAALDKYRITALVKLLRGGVLTCRQQALTMQVLVKKCGIYGAGCVKRRRIKEAERIFSLPGTVAQEIGFPLKIAGHACHELGLQGWSHLHR